MSDQTDVPDGAAAPVDGNSASDFDAGSAPARRSRLRKGLVVGGLLVVLAGLAAMAGVGVLRDRPTFCDQIAALPSMTTSLDTDGSPGGGLVSYADALDEIADAEQDPDVASAARTVADEQRALGAAVGGTVSSDDVVDDVATLDSDASANARDRLDETIASRCG